MLGYRERLLGRVYICHALLRAGAASAHDRAKQQGDASRKSEYARSCQHWTRTDLYLEAVQQQSRLAKTLCPSCHIALRDTTRVNAAPGWVFQAQERTS